MHDENYSKFEPIFNTISKPTGAPSSDGSAHAAVAVYNGQSNIGKMYNV